MVVIMGSITAMKILVMGRPPPPRQTSKVPGDHWVNVARRAASICPLQ
jgi:hypothetical protein